MFVCDKYCMGLKLYMELLRLAGLVLTILMGVSCLLIQITSYPCCVILIPPRCRAVCSNMMVR